MQYTTPNDLLNALRNQLNYHESDGLYIASMDHCPSEQLYRKDWHTTTIILSMGVEHSNLAKNVANRLHRKNSNLSKWKNASNAYRDRFLEEFLGELCNFPQVYVFSISAKETTIKSCLNHFIIQLKLRDKYKKVENGRIAIGPFLQASNKEKVTVTLSENRVAMCLFIAHFVLRMHLKMYEAANLQSPEHPCHVNWNFFGDKFPGPTGNEMDLLFQILLCVNRGFGRILWGYFEKGGKIATDLLVDNLAGSLNNLMERKVKLPSIPESVSPKGLFYWEHWD